MSVIIIRTILLYAIITLGMRIMGKRQLGELQPGEFVITMLVSNIATLPIENTNIPFLVGVIPILTLICFEIFASSLSLKFKAFRVFISGTPKVIIENGIINQAQMKNLRLCADDLMGQLRGVDIFDIREVDYAIVETTGKLSVYKKFASQNITAEMLDIDNKKGADGPSAVVVSDGIISREGLSFLSFNTEWLYKVLSEERQNLSEVFLMTSDKSGNYHIIKKE